MNAQMRELLAKASVVSEVAAARLDPNKTGQQKASDMPPSGSSKSLADRMAERFNGAHTPSEEARAIAWAQHELSRALKRRPQPLNAKQKAYWAIMNGQGKDYRDVAASTGLNEKTVWALRREAGLDPRRGLPNPDSEAA